MPVVTMALVFLLAVVVSTFVVRLLPVRVPLPLLQIAIGAVLSYCFGFEVTFEPYLFLLLFIPPLLFLDGWRIPKGAFLHDWRAILTLAIGLVVFTVVGMGYLLHWLLPTVPLAVAFALAAILSPTDPVAVSAMTANAPVPSRLIHILEGESLLNDATGLVCFTFAVAAVMTGQFSPASASWHFLLVAGGGLLTGVAVTWAIGRLNRFLVRRAGEEPAPQILVSLLIPFAAYLAAEHVHVSGILAAAVAGIAMHYSELSDRPLAATRMQRAAVWDTVQAALNGIIFVLLGDQLPRMLRQLPQVAAQVGAHTPWHLLGFMVVITLMLGLLRFAWVWIAARSGVALARLRGQARVMPSLRLLLVASAAGVRGAITLAGILTLPLLLPDGSAFPARDAVILIAMGVIVLSLLIASISLPWLARGLSAGDPAMESSGGKHDEAHARVAAAEAAIRRIEQALADAPATDANQTLRAEAGLRVLDIYQRRLDYGDASGEKLADIRRLAAAERSLRLKALAAERDELYRLCRAHAIEDDLMRKLVREVDLIESSLTSRAMQ
ncbi:MAG: Na+/H+ antiporter [Thermomonas sp.]|uniref:Na+/H+ antiporter n=1 Tax=Thermomonas sp. TaxID=1971895 RepID=UPI0039E6419D